MATNSPDFRILLTFATQRHGVQRSHTQQRKRNRSSTTPATMSLPTSAVKLAVDGVASILESVMQDATARSGRLLLQYATAEAKKRGRGALYAPFDSITHLLDGQRKNIEWTYVPQDLVAKFDYADAANMVASYDPETAFVLVLSVNMRCKPQPDVDNAVFLSQTVKVHNSMALGAEGAIATEQDLTLRHCNAENCAATANLKVCLSCRDARYCSKQCQTAHWSAHKPLCKALRAVRTACRQAMK